MPTTPPTFVAGDPLAAADLNLLGDGIVELQGVTEGVPFSGFQIDRAGAGSQSIPNTTNTDVTFTHEILDIGGWWSSGISAAVPAGAIPSGFTVIAVHYIALVRFVSNGTGSRKIIVVQNGSEVNSYALSALSGETTTVPLNGYATCEAGDTFGVQVYQSSGGALNMDVARLTIVRHAPVS